MQKRAAVTQQRLRVRCTVHPEIREEDQGKESETERDIGVQR